MAKRIFIVAGELSGDIHGALLIAQLRKLMPDCIIEGIGGPAMQEQGLHSIADFSTLNVSGFWEVIRNYSTLSTILNQCKSVLTNATYDAFIGVDYPGFNMRLGRFARSQGILSICYIAPQLWAWGKSRSDMVKRSYDKLLTVLPFEDRFFAECGIQSIFVGHPLLDRPSLQQITINRNSSNICLMPGSRKQELAHHLPILIPIANSLLKEQYSPVFCIPKQLTELPICNSLNQFDITHAPSELMQEAAIGCVKMGTSTLEAALYGMPFISYYSTSFLSYAISKNKVTLPWISLPNILLQRSLIPELIQEDANPRTMLIALQDILHQSQLRQSQLDGFLELRSVLGGPGASKRAAQLIMELIEERRK
jgi:lipid-A-disaccharide synthase